MVPCWTGAAGFGCRNWRTLRLPLTPALDHAVWCDRKPSTRTCPPRPTPPRREIRDACTTSAGRTRCRIRSAALRPRARERSSCCSACDAPSSWRRGRGCGRRSDGGHSPRVVGATDAGTSWARDAGRLAHVVQAEPGVAAGAGCNRGAVSPGLRALVAIHRGPPSWGEDDSDGASVEVESSSSLDLILSRLGSIRLSSEKEAVWPRDRSRMRPERSRRAI